MRIQDTVGREPHLVATQLGDKSSGAKFGGALGEMRLARWDGRPTGRIHRITQQQPKA
ncbi:MULTISPECIES: hypothetical protein [unclassified Kitasatospora]|uniref:hypothetical protein n=1 Tax=unclassified Kitasatospora TaxID=2633591 RepID=UPI0012F9D6AE|nr:MULTISPECIES: hypothetical protein [unclassified Kitasatospora]